MNKSCLLYGAGNYCNLFFQNGMNEKFNVVGICDSDINKCGSEKYGFSVVMPEKIKDISPELIIITCRDCVSVMHILEDYMYALERTYCYVPSNNTILPSKAVFLNNLREESFVKDATYYIIDNLLIEAYENKVFECEKVFIIGRNEQKEVIIDFFSKIQKPPEIVENMSDEDLDGCRILFVDEDYSEKIQELKKKREYHNMEWFVIPIFDVQNTIQI